MFNCPRSPLLFKHIDIFVEHIIKINAADRQRIVVQLLESNQIPVSVKLTVKIDINILKHGSVDQ